MEVQPLPPNTSTYSHSGYEEASKRVPETALGILDESIFGFSEKEDGGGGGGGGKERGRDRAERIWKMEMRKRTS